MVKNYVPRTVKLEKEDNDRLMKVCGLNNASISTFMRTAILEKLNSGVISNVAGKNKIQYDPATDSFSWVVQLDDGKEVEVLRSLSVDFLQNLTSGIEFELRKRDELVRKKQKDSVAIPKGLVKG